MARKRRKSSKKVRARRLYRRLYAQLGAQRQKSAALAGEGDLRAHLAVAVRFTRLVARLCRVEQLSGEPWELDKVFPPRR